MEIREFLERNKENMIKDLTELVSYDSVSIYNPESEHPFGEETAKVLDSALAMFDREGLKSENVDYHAGYAELGEGEKLIGILAHLDIVPCGTGWTSDPLKLTLRDGKLFGRGSMDDKGPAVCGLYTLKYLKEAGIDLNGKRVRLIVGCNEEAGSRGLAYYVNKEGHIDYGFTPDGSFPGIYGEKGGVNALFASKNTKIIDAKGGLVPNAVCSEVYFKLPKDSVDEAKLKEYFDANEIRYEFTRGDFDELTTYGTAAHASTPALGVNAISHSFKAFEVAGFQDDFVTYYNEYINTNTDGAPIDCKLEDEYGDLTFNNGMIYMKDGHVEGTIDVRVPVTMDTKIVVDKISEKMNDNNGSILEVSGGKPLFFDPESPMIAALVKAYAEVTGDTENKPMVIGGGTYSKGINNCIAFGGEYPGEDNHIHDIDEYIGYDRFFEQTEIYIKAVMNLLQLD